VSLTRHTKSGHPRNVAVYENKYRIFVGLFILRIKYWKEIMVCKFSMYVLNEGMACYCNSLNSVLYETQRSTVGH